MKYDKIDSALYIQNRKNFTDKLKKGAIAIFNSNDIFTTSADSTLPFVQHRDILHLSGVDQEESILLLFPHASDEKHREILFLKETNDLIAVWEGEKLNKEQAIYLASCKSVHEDISLYF